jgi:hypothetical protein
MIINIIIKIVRSVAMEMVIKILIIVQIAIVTIAIYNHSSIHNKIKLNKQDLTMTNKLIIINKMINHKVIKSNVKNLKQMFNEKLKLKLIINTKLSK